MTRPIDLSGFSTENLLARKQSHRNATLALNFVTIVGDGGMGVLGKLVFDGAGVNMFNPETYSRFSADDKAGLGLLAFGIAALTAIRVRDYVLDLPYSRSLKAELNRRSVSRADTLRGRATRSNPRSDRLI